MPAKDGMRRIHGVLKFSAAHALEGIMLLSALCTEVDQPGLPGLPGEAANAA